MKKAKNTLSKEARRTYRRIKSTRAKAQWVGFFYLIATIAITALAVLPTLNVDYVNVLGDGKKLWEVTGALGANVATISAVLYAIMLLTLLINVFKILGKLGWLYKRKASLTYGFNRNALAMQSMGKIFSGSFAVVIVFNFLIALLNGTYGGAKLFDFAAFDSLLAANMFVTNLPNVLLIVAAGVVFHLFLGVWGGKISMFEIDEETRMVVEVKRQVGRFAAFFRNTLQVVVSLVIACLLLQVNKLDAFVAGLLGGSVTLNIPEILQAVIVLCWLVLIVHATNTTEYNVLGAEGKGMKNFKVFIFFTLAASAALYVLGGYELFKFDDVEGTNVLIIAGVSLVMFIIEILMRKAPGLPGEEEEVTEEEAAAEEAEEAVVSDEVDWRYFFSEEFISGGAEVVEDIVSVEEASPEL